jgi:hypothetical protein
MSLKKASRRKESDFGGAEGFISVNSVPVTAESRQGLRTVKFRYAGHLNSGSEGAALFSIYPLTVLRKNI